MFPCALGRAQRGQGNFLGPLLQPRAPRAAAEVELETRWGCSAHLGANFPQIRALVLSVRGWQSPGHGEERDGDPVSPREEQEGEWMSRRSGMVSVWHREVVPG